MSSWNIIKTNLIQIIKMNLFKFEYIQKKSSKKIINFINIIFLKFLSFYKKWFHFSAAYYLITIFNELLYI